MPFIMLGKVFVLYHKFISHPRGTFTWTPHLSVHDNAFMLLRHCFSGRSQHMMVNQTVLDLAPLLSGDSRISLMADTCVQLHHLCFPHTCHFCADDTQIYVKITNVNMKRKLYLLYLLLVFSTKLLCISGPSNFSWITLSIGIFNNRNNSILFE